MINNPALGPTYAGMTGITFFSSLVPAIMSIIMVIGMIVFVFMLLWGGVEWITAGGDKGKIESARQRVSNAVTGLVILLSFFALLNVVECFFGIGLRQFTIAQFNVSFAGTPICK